MSYQLNAAQAQLLTINDLRSFSSNTITLIVNDNLSDSHADFLCVKCD